jgi:hypothetical protein
MTDPERKDFEESIGKAMESTARLTALKVAPQTPASLSEQWDKIQQHDEALRARVSREKTDIIAHHDRMWTEITVDFNRRVQEAMMEIEGKRREALRRLTDETAEKIREHDLLVRRMAQRLL